MNFTPHILLLSFVGYAVTLPKIEKLPSPRSLCGEGPHWDEASQSLYYIDIEGLEASILRYDYKENKTYSALVDNVPLMTFVLPIENTTDEFLVGAQHAAKVIRWDGKSPNGQFLRDAFTVETDTFYDTNRFNDAKSDPAGRFFGGTQRYSGCDAPSINVANASFYRFDAQNGVKQLKENIFVSNGLTWVSKTNKFYYIDSCSRDIKEFDYNINTGELSNERIIFELPEVADYVLDGMTNDIDDNLFVCTYGGSRIIKIDPRTGKILDEYTFPSVSKVTSAAFGGPNLDILYVTTASRGDLPEEAGHLFKITGLGTRGTPGVKVKL